MTVKGSHRKIFSLLREEGNDKGNFTLSLVSSTTSGNDKGQDLVLTEAIRSMRKSKEHAVLKGDGIFGVYKLPSGYYLAIITKSTPVRDGAFPTTLSGEDVRQVDELTLMHIPSRDDSVNKRRGSLCSSCYRDVTKYAR